MHLFIIDVVYEEPLAKIDEYLPQHIEFLKEQYAKGTFIFSGRKEPRTGGMILCHSESINEVQEIIHHDPFYDKGLAIYQVTMMEPSMYSDDFGIVLKGLSQREVV